VYDSEQESPGLAESEGERPVIYHAMKAAQKELEQPSCDVSALTLLLTCPHCSEAVRIALSPLFEARAVTPLETQIEPLSSEEPVASPGPAPQLTEPIIEHTSEVEDGEIEIYEVNG